MEVKHEIQITSFREEHQNGINTMMANIALEFEEPIFTIQSKKIIDVYKLPNNLFWVATDQGRVIGTIGLTKLKNKNIVLKSMFVNKTYRGQGISKLLLDNLISWANRNDFKQIYLGTMLQFIAGRQFYEKNGFIKCSEKELPTDFIINVLDTIFYTKKLKEE